VDLSKRARETTSLLSVLIQSLDDFVLNDATASICGVIVRAKTDLVEATHADLNPVLCLADIVGPAVGAGDGQERDFNLISDFNL
jgi:hypothetical protein